MKIILTIEDDILNRNFKDIQVTISNRGVRKGLHEQIPAVSFSNDTFRAELTRRLKQFVSTEVENYINSQIS